MAIMESTAVETGTDADAPAPRQRRGRFAPHWSTSRVPWIVTGALGVAAVVTALLVWSLDTIAATDNQQRGSITQYCLDMGGSAAQCGDLTLQQSGSTTADSSTASSTDSTDSIAS
jgi:hypothetical protein